MIFFDKKHFCKKINLTNDDMNSLLSSLPKLNNYKSKNLIEIANEKRFNKLVLENWEYGSYQLDKKELENLTNNIIVKKIIKKLINSHKLKIKELILKSSCIFYPSNCKYSFELNNQKYIYHKYHLDSGYRIKALLTLKNSNNENQQFSYINKFPEPLFVYYLRHYFSKLVVLLQKFLYYISLKMINLSGQPPRLPLKYQDPKFYKHYNSLKLGEIITFNNLYPHSSHNGYSCHHTPMLQLVFDMK